MNSRRLKSLPNMLSMFRIAASPVFAILFLLDSPVAYRVAAGVFLIAALSDYADGIIARKYNLVSKTGKFIDPLADKILTNTAFVLFAVIGLIPWWAAITVLARDLAVTIFRLTEIGTGVRDVTILAKAKTMLQMAFIAFVIASVSIFPDLPARLEEGLILPDFLYYYPMALIAALTIISFLGYVFRILKSKNNNKQAVQ
jgi:CDP-diacylglycerol--glycerol-3-phosphate 3-phosphatidyltransferase